MPLVPMASRWRATVAGSAMRTPAGCSSWTEPPRAATGPPGAAQTAGGSLPPSSPQQPVARPAPGWSAAARRNARRAAGEGPALVDVCQEEPWRSLKTPVNYA